MRTLRHLRVAASDSDDVVDLSAWNDDLPVDRTPVDTSFVCGTRYLGRRQYC
jgi:hypothetical protein